MPYKQPPKEHQFKPGISGNPKGMPKGTRSLKTLLQEALIKIGEGNQEPYDILLIKRVMKMAIADGNEAMIKMVWNYLEGMPLQKLGGDSEHPIIIQLSKEIAKQNDINESTGNDSE